MTIYENLLLIASSRKIKKQEAFDKIERILDGLGLKKYENYFPSELSKGTMQRLNNACAMIQEEKITICDEPFSGFDPVQMKLLENVIVECHKKEKGIYIISSHDIECLQNVCNKCLLLHNGQDELKKYIVGYEMIRCDGRGMKKERRKCGSCENFTPIEGCAKGNCSVRGDIIQRSRIICSHDYVLKADKVLC